MPVEPTDPIEQLVTMRLAGVIDMATAPAWQEAIAAVINSHAGGHVCLDLSAVETIDAAGISMLVASRNHAIDNGGRLSVDAHLKASVRQALDDSHLAELLVT